LIYIPTTVVLSILDEEDRVLLERRWPNELAVVLEALAPCRDRLVAVAVESTCNGYSLVDGPIEHGYPVRPRGGGRFACARGLRL